MKKKIGAALLSACMLAVSAMPAFALEQTDAMAAEMTEEDIARQERIQEAERYAYLDLDSASPEMQEKILSARKVIIFSADGWCADDTQMIIIRADGTIEEVPKFSELFPSDWDLPVDDYSQVEVPTVPELIDVIDDTIELLSTSTSTYRNVYLQKYVEGTTSTPFAVFDHNGYSIATKVTQLTSSQTCNIGYSNYNTGKLLGWKGELYPVDSAVLPSLTYSPFTCAVRAVLTVRPATVL